LSNLLCAQRRTKIICAAAFAACNTWKLFYAGGKALQIFQKIIQFQNNAALSESVNEFHKCIKQLL